MDNDFIQDFFVKLFLVFRSVHNFRNCIGDFMNDRGFIPANAGCFRNLFRSVCLGNDRFNHGQKTVHQFLPVIAKVLHGKAHKMEKFFVADGGTGAADLVPVFIRMWLSVFYGLLTAPSLIAAAVFSRFVSCDIAGITASTFDFSGKRIAAAVFGYSFLRAGAGGQNSISLLE